MAMPSRDFGDLLVADWAQAALFFPEVDEPLFMVAHFVKTQKPAQIRATFLLFSYSLISMDFVHAW